MASGAPSWQGMGVGTALMRAALDLADNWLGLRRVELTIYADNATGTDNTLLSSRWKFSCMSLPFEGLKQPQTRTGAP